MYRVVICSGYYNPLTVGHIDYFNEARALGDLLLVIVNNDYQVKIKQSVPFMDEEERLKIVSSIKPVNAAILSIDKDRSVCRTLNIIRLALPKSVYKLIFYNSGDIKNASQCLELEMCIQLGIEVIFGEASKVQSSSFLIQKAHEFLCHKKQSITSMETN